MSISVASSRTGLSCVRQCRAGPVLRCSGLPVVLISSRRASAQVARAAVEDEQETPVAAPSVDYEKILSDVRAKWDGVDNKPAVAAYTAGSVVSVFMSVTLVSAINTVPVLPKLLELVGLVYSAWFTYRYLLFKTSREELSKDINELKKKISGKNNSQ